MATPPPLPKLIVPRPSYLAAALAALAPGLGHWWIGRARRGLGLFALGALGVNALVLQIVLQRREWSAGGLALGVMIVLAAWLWSVIDAFRLAVYARSRRARARRQEHLDAGVRALAEDDPRAARAAFAKAAADDDCDPAALLGLATAERRLGEPARALEHARRALRADAGRRYRDALRRVRAAAAAELKARR
ncbi:MAG TPA: hypothetical protein VEI02_13725 [Planctomycetota bacterium]|nr:hypothetical protein [Planctomycetota bacterium]